VELGDLIEITGDGVDGRARGRNFFVFAAGVLIFIFGVDLGVLVETDDGVSWESLSSAFTGGIFIIFEGFGVLDKMKEDDVS